MEEKDTGRLSVRDAAAILPFIATFLLAPPIILIFAKPVIVAGVPLIVVYLFCVWAAAILCAMMVARRLAAEEDMGSAGRPEEGGRR